MQRRDQGDEVGVAAALAEAVQRALHLARAGVDRGERVRDRVAGVVVGVDAEPVAGDAGGDHRGGDRADLGGQRAAVGVAEHDPAGAGGERGLQAGERVVRVRLPAVEEVLGVEQGLAALGPQEADRGGDVLEVLLEADAERGGDVEVVGLADEADGGRFGVQHLGQHLVVRGGAARALGHAEGGQRAPAASARRRRRRCRWGWRRASRPRRSRCRGRRGRAAIVSLSSTEKSTPWLCCPSRSVVSKR